MFEEVSVLEAKYMQLLEQLTLPEVFNDFTRYSQISKEASKLAPTIDTYRKYQKLVNDIATAQAITDPELAELAKEEIAENQKLLEQTQQELQLLLTPKDERDDANVIIEIRPAAGGDEACLFAAVLLRMYSLYATGLGFQIEITDIEENGIGGVKNVTFMVRGEGAFSKFKFESGVHRVQRVPETESQGRIHTSTATVAVLPEATTVDFQIDEKDLRIDVYRASGAGGQHINKTESAIRITHIPTGVVVECQDERSQHKNKEKALKVLRSRLYEAMQKEQTDAIAGERKQQVGTGDRSERIRTYNYPQGRVTDHRIGLTLYKIEQILNGDLDEVIDSLITFYRAEMLKAKTNK